MPPDRYHNLIRLLGAMTVCRAGRKDEMRRHFRLHSLTLYLVLGFLVLVLLTTLSAGLPAYWVVQQELQVQTWDNVANAQGATLALLQAEEARLADLAALLAARPTLQRLAE